MNTITPHELFTYKSEVNEIIDGDTLWITIDLGIAKTYYRDKYNRYLADIFYDRNGKNLFQVAETGIYLNQQLLEEGPAEKV
ncbi:MAG: hypothetical protein JXB88_21065 [Spirochaetales bacterium]|nr:hypothetical protein [Spirochaetales bacterium]